jgi:glycosyltransferase involved in cell wall biosynthesis
VIAFIVPAHNEERLLARTLESIHQSARALGEQYEIIVADDASTDRTAELARLYRARVVSIKRRQIAAARNAGARAALQDERVQTLVFVDADTSLNEETLRAAVRAMVQGAAGGGAAVKFDGPVPRWAEIMLAAILVVFRLFKWSGGCFIFCSRAAFEATGGWDERLYAAEELYMAQAIKRHGRFVVLREPVVTSGRKLRTHSAREILTSLARIGMHGRRAVRDRKALALWYRRRDTP